MHGRSEEAGVATAPVPTFLQRRPPPSHLCRIKIIFFYFTTINSSGLKNTIFIHNVYKITQESYGMINRERIYTGGLKYMCRIRLQWKMTMITDLWSCLKASFHTKFRFAEREAQCIFGECGPLIDLVSDEPGGFPASHRLMFRSPNNSRRLG